MKITRIETFALSIPTEAEYWGRQSWGESRQSADDGIDEGWQGYPPPARSRPVYPDGISTVIVRVIADNGLVGWGEAKAPVAPRVAKTVISDLLSDLVVGQDPRDVVRLWEEMYASMRLRDHTSGFLLEAISGIDIALWDLLGKSLSVPIFRLLGGAFRTEIPVYASAVPGLPIDAAPDRWEAMKAQARVFVERGFSAMKIALGHGLKGDVASVKAVRETVGEDVELYADAAERYDLPAAIQLAHRLEPFDLGFLEVPLPTEDVDGFAELVRHTSLRLANDCLCTRHEVRRFLTRRALGLVQPDVCRSGGITECHRIAQLADSFGTAFQPHVSLGSAIHFAASLHLAAAEPNLFRMEYWAGENPLGDAVLNKPALSVHNGRVLLPQAPGLGIDIDESKLLSHAS